MSNFIYHILTKTEWQTLKDQESYAPASLKVEGFIHFSTPEQAPLVAKKFYDNVGDLVLLKINVQKLPKEIIYEGSDSIGQDFPHLYCEMPISAVDDVNDFIKDNNEYIFPY